MTNAKPREAKTLRPTSIDLPRRSVLDRPPQQSARRALWAGAGAVGVHAMILGLSLTLGTGVAQRVSAAPISELVEIDLPPPAELPAEERAEPVVVEEPPPAPEPAASEPEARVDAPQEIEEEEPPPAQEPPPEPAEAGKVLTADEEVLDFSDQVISGSGNQFAGGVTTADGTSRAAVRNPNARSGGVVGGTGSGPVKKRPPPIDRSRAPRLAGNMQWSCPFPPEADMEQIDRATVSLRVQVTASGKIENVTVTEDPGYGFGRVATRCAFRKRWDPGLDRLGRPTEATARLRVQFQRQ